MVSLLKLPQKLGQIKAEEEQHLLQFSKEELLLSRSSLLCSYVLDLELKSRPFHFR